jgi:hypothetical protein
LPASLSDEKGDDDADDRNDDDRNEREEVDEEEEDEPGGNDEGSVSWFQNRSAVGDDLGAIVAHKNRSRDEQKSLVREGGVG